MFRNVKTSFGTKGRPSAGRCLKRNEVKR